MKTLLMETPEVAGRVFKLRERAEIDLVARMRDVDEILVAAGDLYPGHTWSRSDLMLMFFLDDIGDSLVKLLDRGEAF